MRRCRGAARLSNNLQVLLVSAPEWVHCFNSLAADGTKPVRFGHIKVSANVGVLMELREMRRLSDGRLLVISHAISRFRVVRATAASPYPRADVALLPDEEEVGLRDFEASFLRLLEKVVNGCEIVISETGTALRYRPGIIVGGDGLAHDCGTSRSIGYFVQPLLALAAFAKRALRFRSP